jgi:outer membrane biosynthesis protein TonB
MGVSSESAAKPVVNPAVHRVVSPRWPREVASVGSVLLHVLVMLMLLSLIRDNSRGARAPARPKVVKITMAPLEKPKPIVPPKPIEPPKEEPPPAPTPAPAPSPKPVQAKPAKAAPAPPQAAPKAPPAPPEPSEQDEMDNVLGRIHDNWLEPPAVPKNFNCRIHIDFAVDGTITGVKVLRGCGGVALDDSVKRAIWKTQPLPLLRKRREAGSLEIDFTP